MGMSETASDSSSKKGKSMICNNSLTASGEKKSGL
jgi:hypothetical protein